MIVASAVRTAFVVFSTVAIIAASTVAIAMAFGAAGTIFAALTIFAFTIWIIAFTHFYLLIYPLWVFKYNIICQFKSRKFCSEKAQYSLRFLIC